MLKRINFLLVLASRQRWPEESSVAGYRWRLLRRLAFSGVKIIRRLIVVGSMIASIDSWRDQMWFISENEASFGQAHSSAIISY
jgi:hypothetical protein